MSFVLRKLLRHPMKIDHLHGRPAVSADLALTLIMRIDAMPSYVSFDLARYFFECAEFDRMDGYITTAEVFDSLARLVLQNIYRRKD